MSKKQGTSYPVSLDPAPPQSESTIGDSLREMYELGKKHGYVLAIKDMQINELEAELLELRKKKATQ